MLYFKVYSTDVSKKMICEDLSCSQVPNKREYSATVHSLVWSCLTLSFLVIFLKTYFPRNHEITMYANKAALSLMMSCLPISTQCVHSTLARQKKRKKKLHLIEKVGSKVEMKDRIPHIC